MVGLIKKDFLMMRGNVKFSIIITIIFLLTSINNLDNIAFIPSFLSIMILMSTFSYDEYNHWNLYATSLPNGRKNIIKAKYLTSFMVIFLANLITGIILFIIGFINHNLNITEIISILYGCTLGILLFTEIMYPFIFKFGIEKARLGTMVIFGFITGLIVFIAKKNLIFQTDMISFLTNYWYILFPIFVLLLGIISYLISIKIFSKKEF